MCIKWKCVYTIKYIVSVQKKRCLRLDYRLSLVFSFLVALLITFATTPLAKILAHKIGAVDIPKDNRRVHTTPIPRLGGLAIYFGFIVSVFAFGGMERWLTGILLGSAIIVALGIIDDIKPLPAIVKLVVQIIAALVVVYYGEVTIGFITHPNIFNRGTFLQFGEFTAVAVTVLWIVGVTNAVNLIDGLDGLAAGVSSIASIAIMFIALLSGSGNIAAIVALVTAAVAGSCMGFLPYNFNPAKIFMGDTGATFLGFILATLSIQGLLKTATVISFGLPLLVLALPIFDTGFAIFRRLKNGKPIMEADRGHLHHRLIDMGFSQRQTVLILYTLSAILGISAIILTGSGAMTATVLILSLLIFVIAGARYMQIPVRETVESNDEDSSQE